MLDRQISEHAETIYKSLPEAARALIDAANFDLHFGPNPPDDDYPGFTAALDIIAAAIDEAEIRDAYIDETGYISTSEPEPFDDYMPEFYIIPAEEIVRRIVGRELVQYL